MLYISKNVAYLRRKADYTQEKLAYILKVGRASISNYEEDATKLSVAIFVRMCQHFKISPNDLLFTDLEGMNIQLDNNMNVQGLSGNVVLLPASNVLQEEKQKYRDANFELLSEELKHCMQLHLEKDERIKLLERLISILEGK